MPLGLPLALGLLLAARPGAADERATSPDPAAHEGVAPSQAAGTAAFAPGEEMELALDYLHIRAGRVRLAVGRPEGPLWPLICQAQTAGPATLLDIREHFVSYWDVESRVPRGFDLNAIEMSDRHTDRVRFDREGGKARVQVLRGGKVRQSTHDVPHDVQDLASALFFLRLHPLEPGARFEYPVFRGTSTSTLQAEVEAIERVETPAGRFDAIRIRVRLGLKDRFQMKRDSYLWVSSDTRHIPLRMTAELAVGRMTATLVAYRPGGQLSAAR